MRACRVGQVSTPRPARPVRELLLRYRRSVRLRTSLGAASPEARRSTMDGGRLHPVGLTAAIAAPSGPRIGEPDMPPLIGDFGFSIQATLPWLFTSQANHLRSSDSICPLASACCRRWATLVDGCPMLLMRIACVSAVLEGGWQRPPHLPALSALAPEAGGAAAMLA